MSKIPSLAVNNEISPVKVARPDGVSGRVDTQATATEKAVDSYLPHLVSDSHTIMKITPSVLSNSYNSQCKQ